jgi:hypothetical protein
VRRADKLYYFRVPIVLKSKVLNLLETLGPIQGCTGFALPFGGAKIPLNDKTVEVLNWVKHRE